jgi:phosphoenolpyruvate carboxylase
MTEQTADMYASLRSNVGHLGQILGETMQTT